MKLMRRTQRGEPGAAATGLPNLAAIFAALTVLGPASRAQSIHQAGKPAAPAQVPMTHTSTMSDAKINVAPASLQAAAPTVRRPWPRRGPESASALLPADPKDGSRGAGLHGNSASDSESNRRDPFRLPLPPVAAGVAGARQPKLPMLPGKRGLVISQLHLEGTVRGGPRAANGGTDASSNPSEASGMIAVVTSASRIAYFLREGDGLYDGRVTRITPDSVWFDEEYLDLEGRMRTRQVVKRLGAVENEEP